MNGLIVLNFCYGVIRPYSVTACEDPYITMDNIVKVSRHFDFCYLINDSHNKDDKEFQYLPPHMVVGGTDTARFIPMETRIKSKYVQVLEKNTLNALASDHIKGTILANPCETFSVVGFCASTDVMATCLGLIDAKQDVSIIPACISDVHKDFRDKAFNYLSFLNVKMLDSEYLK